MIDAVKFDRDAAGLSGKDATLIRFGNQRAVEIMALMGDYFTVGMMMNAIDQHLPPECQPLLPALTRGR